ncbi:MAG: hypothetical protein SGI88_14155 [Candidatus Hydrogenedentes bacterium]|nr:hypothetical protein [Candidatus Hydrogenedentota bacterium]
MRRNVVRVILCACALATVLSPALSLSPPAPMQRVAPIGWETRVTPGFDPPIEYQIVYGSSGYESAPAEDIKKLISSWGPEAFGVLKKRGEDPAWKEFRPTIDLLIQENGSPETASYFAERAKEALNTPDENGPDGNVLQIALHRLRRVAPQEFEKLFEEAFPSASAPARRMLLTVFAFGLSDDTQAETRVARLRAIMKSASEDAERKLIADLLANYATQQRANEPMQRILDIERGNESQP